MATKPTEEQLNKALSEAHDFDPPSDGWGVFAYSDAPPTVCGSGLGSFQWFTTEAELVAFIRDYLAWWHPAPSNMEPEEIAAEVQEIVADSADLGQMVTALNESMRNMWRIEWCGQFRDMCEGDGDFPVRIRNSFHQSVAPVLSDETEAFTDYLKSYGF